jgi:photoactive yellow protein
MSQGSVDTMTETAWTQGSRLAASGASFASVELLDQLDDLDATALDALDFGVVKVDDHGTIAITNRYEAELTAVSIERALGRNYFTDVAPCTNNRLFYGTFRKGIATGTMNLLFFYTFTFKMSPTEVKVHLFRSPRGSNWVLVKRK